MADCINNFVKGLAFLPIPHVLAVHLRHRITGQESASLNRSRSEQQIYSHGRVSNIRHRAGLNHTSNPMLFLLLSSATLDILPPLMGLPQQGHHHLAC